MRTRKIILVTVLAIVIVLVAKYFGLLPGPIVVGGQVS
jgi:hypothetical protein